MKYGGEETGTSLKQPQSLQTLQFKNVAPVQSKGPVALLQNCLEQMKWSVSQLSPEGLIHCEHVHCPSQCVLGWHTRCSAVVRTFAWILVLVHMFTRPVRQCWSRTPRLHWPTWQHSQVVPSGHVPFLQHAGDRLQVRKTTKSSSDKRMMSSVARVSNPRTAVRLYHLRKCLQCMIEWIVSNVCVTHCFSNNDHSLFFAAFLAGFFFYFWT